jgi:hypothetical protein
MSSFPNPLWPARGARDPNVNEIHPIRTARDTTSQEIAPPARRNHPTNSSSSSPTNSSSSSPQPPDPHQQGKKVKGTASPHLRSFERFMAVFRCHAKKKRILYHPPPSKVFGILHRQRGGEQATPAGAPRGNNLNTRFVVSDCKWNEPFSEGLSGIISVFIDIVCPGAHKSQKTVSTAPWPSPAPAAHYF